MQLKPVYGGVDYLIGVGPHEYIDENDKHQYVVQYSKSLKSYHYNFNE